MISKKLFSKTLNTASIMAVTCALLGSTQTMPTWAMDLDDGSVSIPGNGRSTFSESAFLTEVNKYGEEADGSLARKAPSVSAALGNLSRWLMNSKLSDEQSNRYRELLLDGARYLRSDKSYNLLLQDGVNFLNPMTTMQAIDLIEGDENFSTKNRELLGKKYVSLLGRALDFRSWESNTVDLCIKILPYAYHNNREAASAWTKHIWEEHFQNSPEQLRLLLGVKNLDPIVFDTIADRLLQDEMPYLLKSLLSNTHIAAQAVETKLSRENVASSLLMKMTQPLPYFSRSNTAFNIFMEFGAPYFLQHEDLLLGSLYDILCVNPDLAYKCAPLLATPSQAFNDRVFKIFLRFITEKPQDSQHDRCKKQLVDVIFEKDTRYISKQPQLFWDELWSNLAHPNASYAKMTLETDLVLWDETKSLAERSKAFNTRLIKARDQGNLLNFQEHFYKLKSDPVLREYASLACCFINLKLKGSSKDTLDLTLTNLQRLKKDYPEIDMIPDANKFNVFYETSDQYAVMDILLSDGVVDKDGIYGFRTISQEAVLQRKFYNFDKETGDELWSVIINNAANLGTPHFTPKDNDLYVLNYENQLSHFDKMTGELKEKFSIEDEAAGEKLYESAHMGITSQGNIFTTYVNRNLRGVGDIHVILTNPQSQKRVFKRTFTPQMKGARFQTAENYLAVEHAEKGCVLFFNSRGEHIKIDGEPQGTDSKSYPLWSIVNDKVLFSQKLEDARYQLVCLNLIEGEEEWTIPLNNPLIDKPAIGAKNDKAFILDNKANLLAIDLSSENRGKILWTNNVSNDLEDPLTHVYLSKDDSFLYGLEDQSGTLYQFDLGTGELITKNPIKIGEDGPYTIIGTSRAGKVYVRM